LFGRGCSAVPEVCDNTTTIPTQQQRPWACQQQQSGHLQVASEKEAEHKKEATNERMSLRVEKG
jgi:hypothetical protein